MKRVLVLVLVMMLCFGALADTGIDWTQYSEEEINKTIDEMSEMVDEAKAELENRKQKESSKKTFSTSTEDMIQIFDSYMYSFYRLSNIQSYAISYEDKDREEKHLIKLVNGYCSLQFTQEDGKATKVEVISHDIKSDDDMPQVIAGFLSLMAATNYDYFTSHSFDDTLNEIMSDHEPHVCGDVVYRYTDTRPIFKVISLSAEPA